MTNKINSIQYLRAIAAILVVYAHCLNFVGSGNSYQASFYRLKSFGAIGVDIFFVISGFIIAYVSTKLSGPKDTLGFIKKRFVRINPTYYVASILALILRFISKPHDPFPNEEVLKTITVIPLFDKGNMVWKPILYVGWTLAYEWLFYLMFSILLLLSVKRKNMTLVIVFAVTSIIGYLLPIDNIQYNFLTSAIVLEFCMGVIIASMVAQTKGNINSIYPWLALIIGLIWYGFIIRYGYGLYAEGKSNKIPVYYWNRFFIWGIPSALIVFGVIFLEQNGKMSFNNKTLLLLGDASFSIYLIHTIFISFVNKFLNYVQFIPLDILVLCAATMGIIVSVVYYKVIEVPLLRYFNSIFFKKPSKVVTNIIQAK